MSFPPSGASPGTTLPKHSSSGGCTNTNNNNSSSGSNNNSSNGFQNNMKSSSVNLDRNDLIKLLGVLEGELQAREVVIAVLKSERVKQLVYPVGARLARPGPRNPLTQLWQDALAATELLSAADRSAVPASLSHTAVAPAATPGCGGRVGGGGISPAAIRHRIDVNAIHSLQEVQAKLLENMISQNNELLSKVKERCACGPGDDCQLRSWRHLLSCRQEAKEEADKLFESETTASLVLDVVRDREKKLVLLLLGERQRLLEKLDSACQNCAELLSTLREEKTRSAELVDGLEEESKRSLQLEEQAEAAARQHAAQRTQLRLENDALRQDNARLRLELDHVQQQLQQLQHQPQLRSPSGAAVLPAGTVTAPPTLTAAGGGGVRSHLLISSGPAGAHTSSTAAAVSATTLGQRGIAYAPLSGPPSAAAAAAVVPSSSSSPVSSSSSTQQAGGACGQQTVGVAGLPSGMAGPQALGVTAVGARNSTGEEAVRTSSGGRPAPPPVPPNKPALLRPKPAHLMGAGGAPFALATSVSSAVGSTHPQQLQPQRLQHPTAVQQQQQQHLAHDSLDAEIKNFQSVFVAIQKSSPASGIGPGSSSSTVIASAQATPHVTAAAGERSS